MRTYAKALLAAVLAGLTAVATGLTDDHLTSAEWVAAAVATVTAGGAVWRVPDESARALLRRRAATGARRPSEPLIDQAAPQAYADRRRDGGPVHDVDDPQG